MSPTFPPEGEIDPLMALALVEDHVAEDATSRCLVPEHARAVGAIVARATGIIAGMPLLDPAPAPLLRRFPGLRATVHARDGAAVAPGMVIAEIRGPARAVLAIERTALNFLQRLSGIATMTSRFVAAVAGTPVRIQETRKTCPGWRLLDKYAVAVGGGLNHRLGLHDQILIKENHLVFAGGRRDPAAITRGIAAARSGAPGLLVEVEVEDLDQLDAALAARADIVMLDDFSAADIREAVARRRAARSPAVLEVSGGVDLERAAALAATGIDRLSVGALTHSVRALDLAMDITEDRR